jgi:anthranilate phosphoribosyltransferase
MDVKHFLKAHAYQNIPLTYEEAYKLGEYTLTGNGKPLAKIQSIAILSALHNRATYTWQWQKKVADSHPHELPPNAAEQIAGICAAVFDYDIAKSENGFLVPKVEFAMDNCGMGGDLIVTANVSTIAAFIAAAAGIPMCKHGSPANADAGHHGSSDFISLLGINTFASKEEIESAIETEHFGYSEALDTRFKRIHLQTHQFAKLPHMNDIIGPITNPLDKKVHTRRLVGINHLIPTKIVAEAYKILNQKKVTKLQHGLFIRGYADEKKYAGMDELSICSGGTQIAELQNFSEITTYELKAKDFKLKPVSVDKISPPANLSKGQFSLEILKGNIKGEPLKMVLSNAALLFYLAGKSDDLSSCYKMAEEVQNAGLAFEKALAIKEKLPQ